MGRGDAGQCTASLRSRSPQSTLALAKGLASVAGISEVVEITHRDGVGLPVFVSVRPRAKADVYSFGKGLTAIDAEVSAYMEAIEYHYAEPGASDLETLWDDPAGRACRDPAGSPIHDFIPRQGAAAVSSDPMLWVSAVHLGTDRRTLVPAELVFRPAPDVGQRLFGSSTHGLASGNSRVEACLFGLFELIERDIWSLELARQRSRLVDPHGLPERIGQLADTVAGRGLELKIRYVANDYGLPFFASFLFDRGVPRFETFNGGWGCSFDPVAALTQSVTEAAQSRLGFIYGGRNSAAQRRKRFSREGSEEVEKRLLTQMDKVSDPTESVPLHEIVGQASPRTAEEQLDLLVGILRRVSLAPIHQVFLTPPESSLHVVRLIVPTLESYSPGRSRVGERLQMALRERASLTSTSQ